MKMSHSSKAVTLLLLISLQHSFALVDVALCSSALCFPKTTGAEYGKITKKCPEGFSLSKDIMGKAICSKKTALPCPGGHTAKDGNCCASIAKLNNCVEKTGDSCPADHVAAKDCPGVSAHPLLNLEGIASAMTGRKLMGNPAAAAGALVKEINVKGQSFVPNVLIPKSPVTVNMAPAKKVPEPKINLPSLQMPQIIIPTSPVQVTVPPMPKMMPKIKYEGHPSIIPNIVPIIPTSPITIEIPKNIIPPMPKVTTDFTQKVVTIDLTKAGPANTVEVNMPNIPNVLSQIVKVPDIDVNMPEMPKVIDLSGLGPKTVFNVSLPEVKLPDPGSLTIVNKGANLPQVIDLSKLGPKHDGAVNIVLPGWKTNGATVNVTMDDKYIKDIVVPGSGVKHHTVINIPDFPALPEKNAKLVVNVTGKPLIAEHLLNLTSTKKDVKTVTIDMPDLDLSKSLPAGADVKVEIKPLLKLNHTGMLLDKLPEVQVGIKNTTVKIPDFEIPRLMEDKDIKISPKINLTGLMPESWMHSKDGKNATLETTVINLPKGSLPLLPVPKDAVNVGFKVPIKMGLLKSLNPLAEPDTVVDVLYTEEWSGGNTTIPNPAAKITNVLGGILANITTASCPTKCCKSESLDVCKPAPFSVETAPVQVSCEAGCTYDLKLDACLCKPGTPMACPAGRTKCSISGKGVCVPDVGDIKGMDACSAFKTVCGKPGVGVLGKTCSA